MLERMLREGQKSNVGFYPVSITRSRNSAFSEASIPCILGRLFVGSGGPGPLFTPELALFFEFLAQQWILAGALAVAVALLWNHESRKSGQSLTPQRAINLVNTEHGVFLDLRESGEFGQGHIVDAINIPASKLDARLAELEKYRDKPIILVCEMGQNSGAVGKKLNAQGYPGVYRMGGGMMEWGNLQLPLVK